MMNIQIIDSLAMKGDVAGTMADVASSARGMNVWAIVAIVEFAVIVILALSRHKNKLISQKDVEIKKKAMSETVDFGNIVNSAFHAKELYDQLKVKCHPDRFVSDDAKNAIALEIFQLVVKNKNDVKTLQALKQRAIDELGINF